MDNQEHVDAATLSMLKEILEDGFAGLLETFIKDSSERIEQLRGVLEAKDCDGIRRNAHSIKGSASNLGANALASLASDLEIKGRDEDLSGADMLLEKIRSEFSQVEDVMQNMLKEME